MLYDTIIIGGGPAGMSAAIYAGRAALNTLILEKSAVGGQILQTAEIDNYPGSPEEESGASLIARMRAQAQRFDVKIEADDVQEVLLDGPVKKVIGRKETYEAKTVILANGASSAKLGCPGEAELTGCGVSYCATCDGAFFQNLEVYVVGGGDAAVEEAMYLTRFARKVTIIHRRDTLRAAKTIQEKAFANEKIGFLWDSVVRELRGDGMLETIVVENVKTGERTELHAAPEDGMLGLFVFIGFQPKTELYEGKVAMEHGYILTDEEMRTDVPGVFAAGDLRKKSLRQVITAAADGAIAAVQAGKYMEE